MAEKRRLGFVGGGAMAEALIRGIIKAGLAAPAQIVVSDIATERLAYLHDTYGVTTDTDNCHLLHTTEIVVLAVKPQVLKLLLPQIGPAVAPPTLIISIVAGVPLSFLEKFMPQVPVIRVMPNTAVSVREGMAALALGHHATPEHGETAKQLFQAVGRAVIVREELMDAVTGLSGSGPAYTYLFIEALADGGVLTGLDRQTALTLAAQTVLGAAKMVLSGTEHPAALRDRVTSPGGTTIAGTYELEKGGVRAAVIAAVQAATARSRTLGTGVADK